MNNTVRGARKPWSREGEIHEENKKKTKKIVGSGGRS
jgi:hypothetical protein